MQRIFLALVLAFQLVGVISAQTPFTSALPIILIDTEGQAIPDEPKRLVSMGVIDNGVGETNRSTDAFNAYDGYAGIELRGSSTLFFAKQGYGLETRFADGSDRQVALLDFPVEEDWVLRGPYADKSLIRDALAYTLAADIMPYAPRVRQVELVINGEYQGVYLLVESIKRDRNRVAIKKLEAEDDAGDALTGGYILKHDRLKAEVFNEEEAFPSLFAGPGSNRESPNYVYHYPKPEDITREQRSYIRNWIGDFETTLAGEGYRDPATGYAAYLDVESFVDYFIINELTRNVDGYRLSTYMYKDRDSEGGKLTMGPIWDYNLSFGNADYCDGGFTTGWAFRFNEVCPEDAFSVPFYWKRLLEDPAFDRRLRERWDELRQGVLSDAKLNARIDSLVATLGDAPARNFDRWPVLGQYVWPNAFIGQTYAAEVDYLRGWVQDRTNWLDGAFLTLSTTSAATQSVYPLTVRPNPTSGRFRALNEAVGDLRDFSVADQSGRVILRHRHLGYANVVDLTGYPAGMYFLQGTRTDGTMVRGRVVLAGR